MKILVVSSYLPYPLLSGGQVRLYNLIRELKNKGHKITLVCEKRDFEGNDDVERVRKICEKVIVVKRRKQWSLGNILKAGLSSKPFLIVGHTNKEMKSKIGKLLKEEKFDLIHVETFYVMQNIPKTNLPIVLVEHNIEYMVYKRYASNVPLLLRPLLLVDVAKIRRAERSSWRKATKLIAVSEAEKKQMNRNDVVVVPNGVNTEKFQFKREKSEEKIILFIGDFKWIQNRDAVSWIVKNVWPKILNESKLKKLKVKLWIVGKRIPENIKALSGPGIFFDENAPVETELIFQKAYILLSPIRVGGGTSFKILESMATGLPVITTALGNEGIGATVGKEILIDEDDIGFSNDVIKLIQDKKFYDEISKNAHDFIAKNYDWGGISKKLENAYQEVIRNG